MLVNLTTRMKKMRDRFETYINEIQARKEYIIEKKGIQPRKSDYCFFTSTHSAKKLNPVEKIEVFLTHVKEYEESTRNLIEQDQENKQFYENHYSAVIDLLEKIDKADYSKLSSADFRLIVPQTAQYKKTTSDTFIDILAFSGGAALCLGTLCGILGVVLAFICLIAILMYGISANPLQPLLMMDSAFGTGLAVIVGIAALPFFIVGAIIGAPLGLLIGLIVVPFLEDPLQNSYVNGKAFKSKLLIEAYAAWREVGSLFTSKSANEQEINFEVKRNTTSSLTL